MNQSTLSILHFEQTLKEKKFDTSCQMLINIIQELDKSLGLIHNIHCEYPQQLSHSQNELSIHFCTRMANAVTELFQPENHFVISESQFQLFMTYHRWLALIFASSTFVTADHILRLYDLSLDKEKINSVTLDDDLNTVRKFCVLYFLDSHILLNLEKLWEYSPEICISLCYALQSPRFIATYTAYSKRAAILQWLPEKLEQFDDLSKLPASISHDIYMHCSYDISPNKHLIKKSINQLIRKFLLDLDWKDNNVSQIKKINNKPVMFVILEYFHSGHSIYRTHSTSLIAAKTHFHLVGFGNANVDQAGKNVFDEFFTLDQDSIISKLTYIHALSQKYQPAICYMPSIGMDLTTIFLSNTRIAPLQAIALGHPATTHSPFIDFVVVEDDYVGSEKCFSEQLIRLPKDALPYVPSALAPKEVIYNLQAMPNIVHIGVASTTMKLNYHFLQACREILQRAKVKIHFHFALGQSIGIIHPYVARFIQSYLGENVSIYGHRPYQEYLDVLKKCDMMINPFPFGNTNGIIDMVTLGLVGICKTGNEVHEHIDEALFARLGLPLDKLVTSSVDDYITRAIELAENHEERLALRHHIIKNNRLNALFTGNPKPMGEIFLKKLQEQNVI